MTAWTGQAAAVCAAVVLSATIVARTALPAALPLALAACALLLAFLLGRLGTLPRVLLAIMAAVFAASVLADRAPEVDLEPALFAFAFVLATGLLREIAMRDPSFRALGEALVGMGGPGRFPVVSLAVTMLGLTLLIGALQFLAGLVAERGAADGGRSRTGVLRAGLAGYIMIPLLSPIAIPFVVVSGLVDDLVWTSTLPIMLAVAAATWTAAFLQDLTATPPRRNRSDARTLVRPAVAAKAFTPVAMAAFLHWGIGLRAGDAAMIAIVLAAVGWAMLLPSGGALLGRGLTASANEATIIGASIATGIALLSVAPTLGETLPVAAVPEPLLPPLFFAAFILPGLVGVQPALCFMLVTPLLAVVSGVAPEAMTPVLAAVISGWALNSVTSPFGLPILIVARADGVTPLHFLVRKNVGFTVGVPLAAALVLAVVGG